MPISNKPMGSNRINEGFEFIKTNFEIDETSKNVRIHWKKKMIEEHLKGLNWHKDCIDRLKKEIIKLEHR